MMMMPLDKSKCGRDENLKENLVKNSEKRKILNLKLAFLLNYLDINQKRKVRFGFFLLSLLNFGKERGKKLAKPETTFCLLSGNFSGMFANIRKYLEREKPFQAARAFRSRKGEEVLCNNTPNVRHSNYPALIYCEIGGESLQICTLASRPSANGRRPNEKVDFFAFRPARNPSLGFLA